MKPNIDNECEESTEENSNIKKNVQGSIRRKQLPPKNSNFGIPNTKVNNSNKRNEVDKRSKESDSKDLDLMRLLSLPKVIGVCFCDCKCECNERNRHKINCSYFRKESKLEYTMKDEKTWDWYKIDIVNTLDPMLESIQNMESRLSLGLDFIPVTSIQFIIELLDSSDSFLPCNIAIFYKPLYTKKCCYSDLSLEKLFCVETHNRICFNNSRLSKSQQDKTEIEVVICALIDSKLSSNDSIVLRTCLSYQMSVQKQELENLQKSNMISEYNKTNTQTVPQRYDNIQNAISMPINSQTDYKNKTTNLLNIISDFNKNPSVGSNTIENDCEKPTFNDIHKLDTTSSLRSSYWSQIKLFEFWSYIRSFLVLNPTVIHTS